VNKSETDFVMD